MVSREETQPRRVDICLLCTCRDIAKEYHASRVLDKRRGYSAPQTMLMVYIYPIVSDGPQQGYKLPQQTVYLEA